MMWNRKTARIFLWTAFAFYHLFLLGVLFLGRGGRFQGDSFWEYAKYSVNLIPFRTIWGYVRDYMEQGGQILALAFRNIAGNFVLFFPMGIFLPCLFPKTEKFHKTALISICTIFGVELLQLLLRRGIFDVDDLILNISGWLLGFAVLKNPFINKILKKIYLLPQPEDIALHGGEKKEA